MNIRRRVSFSRAHSALLLSVLLLVAIPAPADGRGPVANVDSEGV